MQVASTGQPSPWITTPPKTRIVPRLRNLNIRCNSPPHIRVAPPRLSRNHYKDLPQPLLSPSPLTSVSECPVFTVTQDVRARAPPWGRASHGLPQARGRGLSSRGLPGRPRPASAALPEGPRGHESSDPLTTQRLAFLQRGWTGAFTGANGRDRQGPSRGIALLWGEKYAKEKHGPGHSFCPPRPCVLLAARKVSQSGGLGWLRSGEGAGQRWPEPPPSQPRLPRLPPAQWPPPAPAVLPPGLCSRWALPLDGASPATSTHRVLSTRCCPGRLLGPFSYKGS